MREHVSNQAKLAPLTSELLKLAAMLISGSIIVALLIFAPRTFLVEQPFTTSNLWSYINSVGQYLFDLVRGDLGPPLRGRPLGPELLSAARRSFELLGVSVAVALPLGLVWGSALASVRRRLASFALFGLSTVVLSLPSFVIMLLAIEAIATLTHRTGVRIALVHGYGLDQHLILPTAVLATRGSAFMARAIQVAQEEVMRQDWIRAARARGIDGLALWWRHVVPALRLPMLSSTLGMLRVMMSGLVIVDYLYGWNGLGNKLLQVNQGGTILPTENRVAAGAGIVLVVFFVLTDAFGRLLQRRFDPRMQEMAHTYE